MTVWTITIVMSPDNTSAGVPAVNLEPRRLPNAEYSAPLAPVVGPMIPDRLRPTLPAYDQWLPQPQTNQWEGCPYQFTTYRNDDDHAIVDSPFGVQVHHPQFLEWVGAPESACLPGRPLGR